MSKWDDRFINLALVIANWSKDPSRKIGAVIVDNDNRIVSTGFNGFAKGVPDKDELLNDKETKRKLMLHAEENAILYAKQDLKNCRIYIAGLPPCIHCALMIIQSGISKVYFKNTRQDKKISSYWNDNINESLNLLKQNNIDVFEL